MTGRLEPTCPCTMLVVVTALVIVLVNHGISVTGGRCRFAKKSGTKGRCIFPCRCTNGCNTTTGDCINGGRCEGDHPSGYTWGGPACQIGNVGYKKSAKQSGEKSKVWSMNNTASNALDGNTDSDLEHKSCAHPSNDHDTNAWWTVDLGQKHNITHVVIYNRKSEASAQRLNTFTLSVGKKNQNLTECASHDSRVPASGNVTVSCGMVGRYLRFERNGGFEQNVAGLCEVVIIGYRFIDCLQKYCSSMCSDVIGCDTCAPGRQQPRCKKACNNGTYGNNCQDVCGHCKGNSSCNAVNGTCSNGCEDWYINEDCNTNIHILHFGESQVPEVDVKTSTSVTVRWPEAYNDTSDLESYYYYVVWLQAEGETENIVANVTQHAHKNQNETLITKLVSNTRYSVKVEPYRHHYGNQEAGNATVVTRFKTKCNAPEKAIIENAAKLISASSTHASMVVTWKVTKNSGCDEIVSIGVQYKSQASQNERWSYKQTDTVIQTQITIDVLSYEMYDVNVIIKNNENITSTSETITSDLRTRGPHKSESEPWYRGLLGAGRTAGGLMAIVIVVACVVFVVGFMLLRRRRAEQRQRTTTTSLKFMNSGSGEENIVFDDGKETAEEEDDGNNQCDQVGISTAIYANTQRLTYGVALGDLAAYINNKRRNNGFAKEFGDIPFGIHAKCKAAEKPDNKSRNRFLNILAYDHTRVLISTENGQCDYINANHIMGYNDKENAYIACQGPRDWNVEDMYNMIWQEQANTIVMLANVYEMGKEKCSQYWPGNSNTKTWGIFQADGISEDKYADYTIREFSLKNKVVKKMRRIRQLHFTGWPDKGTPEFAYPLLAFHRKVRSFDLGREGPLVVHCSAGVGRTGTFIAIDILTEQVKAEGRIDVFRCVNQLRTQRMNMVQTLEQYIYVYQALVELTEIAVVPCFQLKQTFEEMCMNRKFAEQFERLNALKPVRKRARCSALEPKNVAKNRFIEIVPDDDVRPYLVTPWKEGTNYINAVYVHGYKERNAFILTQSPMSATVVDFWRLINDHEARSVVILDDSYITDDEGVIYCPSVKATKGRYGPFDVEVKDIISTESSNVTVREFMVNKYGRSEHSGTVIKQFQLNTSWSRDPPLPGDTSVLLNLLDALEKWQQLSGNGPIVIHCTDGAGRCGLVCAASYLLEHMKVEQEVDVFHAVQHVRTTRPQLITHLAQYRFLYELALTYMSLFDLYANFQ